MFASTKAPLSPNIAALLSPRVNLATLWGTSETGYLISQETDPEDFAYFCFDARRDGIRWEEIASKVYEMRYIRLMPNVPGYANLLHPQYVFLGFSNDQEYSAGDIFSKHPTKPDHWKHEGRVDDNIVLSIGQNVNPRAFEERVEKHPSVKSATVIGNGRAKVCMLLELEDSRVNNREGSFGFGLGNEFENDIWPTIQRASQGMRTYEQVERSMIIMVTPDKLLPRNHKGAVKRGAASQLYQDEIELCYAK